MNASEKLIDTIRERNIKPVPKGLFMLKNALIWLGFAAAVLLGAIAFSVILFCIQQTDFELLVHIDHSRLEMFLAILPFFWIAFLGIFLIVAMVSIQHSAKGYKFSLARLAGFSAALSILAGTLVFIAGGAGRLEQAFDVRVGIYESMQEKKVKIWSMPENGYLSGEIVNTGPNEFQLKDFNSKIWTVRTDSAFVAPVVQLEKGEIVKLVGTKLTDSRFNALEIRPWGGPGMRRKH
jgi:hypothetical protein